MPDHPDAKSLEALRAFDTPTICNALEIVAPARRTIGFHPAAARGAVSRSETGRRLRPHRADPLARTASARTAKPPTAFAWDITSKSAPRRCPRSRCSRISTRPIPGSAPFGARCRPMCTPGSAVSASSPTARCATSTRCRRVSSSSPARSCRATAYVHLVDFGGTVTVAGMVVSANDIIHADRHGAVVIPADAVAKIPAAVDLLARREKVIIEASKQPRLLDRAAAPSLPGGRTRSTETAEIRRRALGSKTQSGQPTLRGR